MSPQAIPARQLRANPDLDQLKRQAKELCAAFRAGEAGAVAEVNAHFRGAEPSGFALHDAQLVLARAYGFASWPKLKTFVDGATVSRLIAAVKGGDLKTVEQLLNARPEIVNMDATGGDEHRALHHAVLARSAAMVRLLMDHGADARIGIYPHRVPTTPLQMAMDRGYEEIVAIIVEAESRRPGIPRPIPGPEQQSPPPGYTEAMERADSRAVISVLEPLLGMHPTLATGMFWGMTLLHVAAARLMTELAAWLIAHGGNVHARSDHDFTPIDMLGRWPPGHPQDGVKQMSDLLLRHGAERTAFWAIAMGDADWLRQRHKEGRLHNPVTDAGGLLSFAVRLDRPEILALLLDLGLDPDERVDPSRPGGLPIEFCLDSRRFHMVDMLLARGVTLTPTMAVALGRGDWLRAQHAAGTLSHPAEGDGLLTAAVEYERRDMLELLLDLGFDPDERKRVVGGDTVHESRGVPLERCVERGNMALAELLLTRGADSNCVDDGGGTAVSMAYRRRNTEMLDLLLRHGGQVSAGTAGYHRDIVIARQRIREEDEGTLPPGSVTPGNTVAEDLLGGDCGEPEIVRMALARIDWSPDNPRWYGVLRGPLCFWNYVPWIESPSWQLDRTGYLTGFRLILARCHANVRGSFGRTILHDVMAMGHHDGSSGWIREGEALDFAITLLDAGARTDVRDDLLGSTPLGWACRYGRLPIVAELLRRGVDAIEADAEPWAAPLAWARRMKHDGIVELLEKQVQSSTTLRS